MQTLVYMTTGKSFSKYFAFKKKVLGCRSGLPIASAKISHSLGPVITVNGLFCYETSNSSPRLYTIYYFVFLSLNTVQNNNKIKILRFRRFVVTTNWRRQIPNKQLVLQEKLLHDRFFQRMFGCAPA